MEEVVIVNRKLLTFRCLRDTPLNTEDASWLKNVLKIEGMTEPNLLGANANTNCTGTYGGKKLGGTLKMLLAGQDYKLTSGVFSSWLLPGAVRVFDLGAETEPVVPQAITFQIKVPVAGTVSAGAYHPVTDVQVAEIFANKAFLGGVTQEVWDGTNWLGQPVSDPLSYVIKWALNPLDGLKGTFEDVLGNSSPISGPGKINNAHFIPSMVEVGEKLYWAVGRSEGDAQCYHWSYKTDPSYQHWLGDHREHSVYYVCTDGKKVYWAGVHGDSISSFCTATDCENGDADVQFQFGTRFDLSNCTFYAINVQRDGDVVTGSAVQRAGNFLFFAHGTTNQVRVLDKNTGQYLRTWAATDIREIALLDDNTLLGIRDGVVVEKYTIDANGNGTAVGLPPLAGLVEPMAIATKLDGSGFSVTDGSRDNDPSTTARHCVRHYTASGTAAGVLGASEGYTVNTTVRDDKFNFCCIHSDVLGTRAYGPVKPSLMYQANGDLWVADIGHFRYQHFSSTGVYIDQIMYLGYNYSVSANPKRPRDVYAGFLQFDSLTRKLVKDWSAGWNKDYDDQEKRMRYVTTSPDGSVTYCLLQSQNKSSNTLPQMFVELPEVGTLRYTQVFTEHINCALNSDFTLDSENNTDSPADRPTYGELGQPQVRYTRTVTVDANRNPVLGPKTVRGSFPAVRLSDPIQGGAGLGRDQFTSTGRILSFSSNMPDQAGNGRGGNQYHIGFAQDNEWKARTAYNTTRRYQGGWATDGSYDIGKSAQNGGTIAQVIAGRIGVWGNKGEFRGGKCTNEYTAVLDNGLQLGRWGKTNDSGSQLPYGTLGIASNATTFSIVQDGADWLQYNADEGYVAGILKCRITGTQSIVEGTATLTLADSPASIRRHLNAGLAYDVSVAQGDGGRTRTPDVDGPIVNRDTHTKRIATSIYTTNRRRVEVTVESHPQSMGEPPVSYRYPLGDLPGNVTSYGLEGLLNWTWNSFDPPAQPGEFHGWRLYDDQGRLIAASQRTENAFPSDYRMLLNGLEAARLPAVDWNMLSRYLQPFRLLVSREGFLLQFAGFPLFLCTRCADPEANWQRPAVFEVSCESATNREGIVSTDLDFFAS